MSVVLLAGCADSAWSQIGEDDSAIDARAAHPVVHTAQGDVRAASVSGGIALFSDIPYAAPPVGDRRWKPPAPHASWTGVFAPPDTTECTPTLPAGMPPGKDDTSEDCLYLDVYAPAAKPASPLPVLFYIHGGFGLWGTKDFDSPDGEIAKFGNMIVVSINYRLGVFGYLAHPALTTEQGSSGNYAHLDQIAALRWVKENIARFGGDPDRVTLSGQSWGGQSACVLMASPLAAGLFSQVFDMSGVSCRTWDRDTAYAAGSTLVDKTGCSSAADVLACLRGKSEDRLTGAVPLHLWATSEYRWRAVVDGNVLPDKAQARLEAGNFNKVPLIIGNTSLEVSGSDMMDSYYPPLSGSTDRTKMTPASYTAAVRKVYGDRADAILAHYPVTTYAASTDRHDDVGTGATAAFSALLSDDIFVCPSRRVARAVAKHQTASVRRYEFDPTGTLATEAGHFHGEDTVFTFDQAHTVGSDTVSLRAERTMAGYLSRFVAAGDPNGDGASAWAAYDAAKDNAIVFDDPVRKTEGIRSAECDFWDSITVDP
jgi:para-nitrobenzyl esterase